MASTNIRMGPIIQFWTNDMLSTFQLRKNVAQLLVPHLGQRRVHHQDQTDRDGDVRRARLETIDELLDAGKK